MILKLLSMRTIYEKSNPNAIFEWYLPHDGNHWTRLADDAEHLANLGISHIWMPPAFKATNEKDVGYGVYDLFDLRI